MENDKAESHQDDGKIRFNGHNGLRRRRCKWVNTRITHIYVHTHTRTHKSISSPACTQTHTRTHTQCIQYLIVGGVYVYLCLCSVSFRSLQCRCRSSARRCEWLANKTNKYETRRGKACCLQVSRTRGELNFLACAAALAFVSVDAHACILESVMCIMYTYVRPCRYTSNSSIWNAKYASSISCIFIIFFGKFPPEIEGAWRG